jgi:Tfp pilus assembly protein FimV
VPSTAAAATPRAGGATVGGHPAKSGDRTHAVLPGESLWTIATDLLGSDATTARVAREVHRLWQLNRDRIGTGDANLLMVGTRLELR